ncbi:MAG: hypothetical protein JXD18_11795 [Anaerolineae bacterium]|nr:hypothetical protein [Anaerolineae bacterium]
MSRPTSTPSGVVAPEQQSQATAEPTPYNGGYLPQTGLATPLIGLGVGLACVALGVAWVRRRTPKKEDASE